MNQMPQDAESGYQNLNQRYQAVTRILEILNTNQPIEGKVRDIGQALKSLFAFDRFTLGLLWSNRWYRLDGDALHLERARREHLAGVDHSATQWVIRNRYPLVRGKIPDAICFTYDRELIQNGFQSDLTVPLIADRYVIGTFNFNSLKAGAYTQADLKTAETVASAVAAVVKLFQDQIFLNGIREISEAVQGSLDLNEVLQMVLSHIQSQGYDRVRVYLYDASARELAGTAQIGAGSAEAFQQVRLSVERDPYSEQTFKSRRARIYKFAELSAPRIPLVEEALGGVLYSEKADLPLFVIENGKDRIVGKISLDNGLSGMPLVQERLDALMVYASQAAIAIRHAQLYRRLERDVEVRTELLRESEERFRRLSEAAFEGVVISENGAILDVNRAFCDMLGHAQGDLIGQRIVAFVAPEVCDEVAQHIASGYEQPYESRMIRKDGDVFPVEVRARMVPYEGRTVRVSAVRDITERKQIERELVRLERLNAIGEMAQGVAHNFNNILVGVLGNAQLIEMRTKDPDILEDAGHIIKSAFRARDLVLKLNLSVLGETEQLAPVDVNAAVLTAVDLTRPRWKDQAEAEGIDIEVVTRLGDVARIEGTQARMRDLVVNLLFNAVDAMPDGGRISIETAMYGDRVQLVFADTGVGMEEHVRRRVFEPFFTTKFSVGSGLGLSTVYGTVRGWKGTIALESAPGKGARFILRFPKYSL